MKVYIVEKQTTQIDAFLFTLKFLVKKNKQNLPKCTGVQTLQENCANSAEK